MKKDNYQSNYICEKDGKIDFLTKENCKSCLWWNGEQCIRKLLTEGDIEEIINERRYYIEKRFVEELEHLFKNETLASHNGGYVMRFGPVFWGKIRDFLEIKKR